MFCELKEKKKIVGTSLVVQWLRLHFHRREQAFGSLVTELRSRMPCVMAKNKNKT